MLLINKSTFSNRFELGIAKMRNTYFLLFSKISLIQAINLPTQDLFQPGVETEY